MRSQERWWQRNYKRPVILGGYHSVAQFSLCTLISLLYFKPWSSWNRTQVNLQRMAYWRRSTKWNSLVQYTFWSGFFLYWRPSANPSRKALSIMRQSSHQSTTAKTGWMTSRSQKNPSSNLSKILLVVVVLRPWSLFALKAISKIYRDCSRNTSKPLWRTLTRGLSHLCQCSVLFQHLIPCWCLTGKVLHSIATEIQKLRF